MRRKPCSLEEETAAALNAIEPGSALAQVYRDQPAAMRAGSAAEREGFVKSRDPYVTLSASLKRYGEDAENIGGMVGDALTSGFRRGGRSCRLCDHRETELPQFCDFNYC